MATDKNTLKNWFLKGAKPLASQFAAWMDSYWHKDEKIAIGNVDGLQAEFDKKADVELLTQELFVLKQADSDLAAANQQETKFRQQNDVLLKEELDLKADSVNVYTKTEIDNKIASVYTAKGSVANRAALPTTGNKIGDVYNLIDTGMNVAYTGNDPDPWDDLGSVEALATAAQNGLLSKEDFVKISNLPKTVQKADAAFNSIQFVRNTTFGLLPLVDSFGNSLNNSNITPVNKNLWMMMLGNSKKLATTDIESGKALQVTPTDASATASIDKFHFGLWFFIPNTNSLQPNFNHDSNVFPGVENVQIDAMFNYYLSDLVTPIGLEIYAGSTEKDDLELVYSYAGPVQNQIIVSGLKIDMSAKKFIGVRVIPQSNSQTNAVTPWVFSIRPIVPISNSYLFGSVYNALTLADDAHAGLMSSGHFAKLEAIPSVDLGGQFPRNAIKVGNLLSSYSTSDDELSPWQSGFSVNTSTGVFTKANHGFVANTAIELRQNGGMLPTGFLGYQDVNYQEYGLYYTIQVLDVNTFTLSNPFTNTVVKPTDVGSGAYQMRSALNKISIPVPKIAVCTSLSILIDFIIGYDSMMTPMLGFSFNNDQANTCLCRGKKNYFALPDLSIACNMKGLVEIVITHLENGYYFVRANMDGCSSFDNTYYSGLINSPYPIVGKWLNNAELQTIEFGDFGNNTRWLKSLSASIYQQ